MSRKAAAFTEADITRCCKGARKGGARYVHIEMASGVKFSISLDKDLELDNYNSLNLQKDEDNFTL